jgi:hypothetical protein
MEDVVLTASGQEKVDGQGFWDTNPCGGTWTSYNDFLVWMQHTEPYAFEIILYLRVFLISQRHGETEPMAGNFKQALSAG